MNIRTLEAIKLLSIRRKHVPRTHSGQLVVIFVQLSGMYFQGARFSNYEAWLSDPIHTKPCAQVVRPIVLSTKTGNRIKH